MSDKSNLLRAEGINKSFGAVIAAKDININIQKGERVSLIGSNGAGKTTFMNIYITFHFYYISRVKLVKLFR